MTFEEEVRAVCTETAELLIAKNKAYGNSALDPVRVFSKASTEEQILVRLDDKLSRLARGQAAGEDVFGDIRGYLVLLEIARRRARAAAGHIYPSTEHIKIADLSDDALAAAWERDPTSRSRLRNPLVLLDGAPVTLVPGDVGYDETLVVVEAREQQPKTQRHPVKAGLSGVAWRRVPESLAVSCEVDGQKTTLMPGDEGYDDVARTLGVPGVRS
jgi:hypothetical protein